MTPLSQGGGVEVLFSSSDKKSGGGCHFPSSEVTHTGPHDFVWLLWVFYIKKNFFLNFRHFSNIFHRFFMPFSTSCLWFWWYFGDFWKIWTSSNITKNHQKSLKFSFVPYTLPVEKSGKCIFWTWGYPQKICTRLINNLLKFEPLSRLGCSRSM